MHFWTLTLLLLLASALLIRAQLKNAIHGTKCAKNQIVNKLTVYEDGAIEAECGPIPCGSTGERCIDDQTSCKVETDVFSGMKWAKNGQSLLLRCCSVNFPNKIYIGTDLVTLGSYYTGGAINKKDMYGKDGVEYDFVVNARTEQNGVRVWVYRIMCPAVNDPTTSRQQQLQLEQQKAAAAAEQPHVSVGKNQAFEKRRQYLLKQIAESQDPASETVASAAQEESVINPLQYRPPTQRQRDQPIIMAASEARIL